MRSIETIRSMMARGRVVCASHCEVNCVEPCALASLPAGVRAVVVRLACPHAEAEHLRVMGVFEGASIGIVDRGCGFLFVVLGLWLVFGGSLVVVFVVFR